MQYQSCFSLQSEIYKLSCAVPGRLQAAHPGLEGFWSPVVSSFKKINKNMKRELTALDRDFISFCIDKLELKTSPKIRIGDDHRKSQEVRAMGYYSPSEDLIWVLRGKRVPADWYRTLAHELVHWRQRELGQQMDGSDGSDLENEANSKAAVLLREYGRPNPEIYTLEQNEPILDQDSGSNPPLIA